MNGIIFLCYKQQRTVRSRTSCTAIFPATLYIAEPSDGRAIETRSYKEVVDVRYNIKLDQVIITRLYLIHNNHSCGLLLLTLWRDLSVCMFIMTVSPAKPAEPIEIPLRGCGFVGPQKPRVTWGRTHPNWRGTFGDHALAWPDSHAVDMYDLISTGQQRCGLYLPVYCSNLLLLLLLRSTTTALCQPFTTTTSAKRAFRCSAPAV